MKRRHSFSVLSRPEKPLPLSKQLRTASSCDDLLDQASTLQKVGSSASFNSQVSIPAIQEDIIRETHVDALDEDDEDREEDCIHTRVGGEPDLPGPVIVEAVKETVESHQPSNSLLVMITSKGVECAEGDSLVTTRPIQPPPLLKSRSISVLSEGSPDLEMKELIVHEMQYFNYHQCSHEEINLSVAPLAPAVPPPLVPDSPLFVSPIAVIDDCASSQVVL